MDVKINGEDLDVPELENRTSFSDLMNDLNRQIGSRNEIITEVKADGREIVSWDMTELDMSRLTRLEISTLPARDFAISSFGDVGDYAGEVLSVLKNVENICAKEGFEPTRAKLIEGLNYILTVIESSSKVLELNLAESHYDVRTGGQMLTEMVSLKNRIGKAPDFAAARTDLSELEYTLVDWLKFLETLLQRYRDRQAEVGEVSEVHSAAREKMEGLDRLEADIKRIVEDMYAGRIAKSMEQFQDRIQVLQDSLLYLDRLRRLGRISFDAVSASGENLSVRIQKVTPILQDLSESIRIGDSVLTRDLLEYEILPFIDYIRRIYAQISSPPARG